MAQAPDQVRRDIEATRSDLARDVDRLAERALPTRVARRRWSAVKGRADTARDRLMVVPDQVAASGRLARREGDPLAAGLVAFGVGLLAASLIPETGAERRAGRRVRRRAGALADRIQTAQPPRGG